MITSPSKQQRGFSLVELMVALVVSLLLLAGILEILLGNRESFQVQQDQAALQENSRLANFLLHNSLSLAGFHTNALRSETEVFGANPVISGTDGGDATTPDRIRVRYEGGGNVQDCLGTTIGTPAAPQITDFEYFLDVADQELACRVFNPDGSVRNTQPLVNNVQNLQIEYGLDSNNDNSVDRYLTPDSAGFDPQQVRLVRVQLVLATPDNVLLANTAQTLPLVNGDVTYNDRLQRQFLEQIIALRNRLP